MYYKYAYVYLYVYICVYEEAFDGVLKGPSRDPYWATHCVASCLMEVTDHRRGATDSGTDGHGEIQRHRPYVSLFTDGMAIDAHEYIHTCIYVYIYMWTRH